MLQKGLDWKRRKKAGKEKDHPYSARGKTKAAAKCLPKVQCLITDFTIVSTQSIARRMHMRNFELWSFPRPVVLLHEPCGCRREAKNLVNHVITRTYNAGSIVAVSAKLACSGSLYQTQFLLRFPGCCLALK